MVQPRKNFKQAVSPSNWKDNFVRNQSDAGNDCPWIFYAVINLRTDGQRVFRLHE